MTNDITSKVIIGMDVKQFRKGVQSVDNSIRRMSKRFQNLGSIIGASFAFSQIQSFAAEAVELNSQLTKAAAGFKRFGDAADLASMRKSTMGLVTDLELMQQSVKGANLGIPIRDMGILLEFAKRRADETGESMDHLVNSIVEGIGRKSTRRLDNLGISAQRLKEAVGGVSLEMADVADVSKAMVGIAEEELAKMGDATITAADKMAQLSVEFQNAKASAGELFASLGLGALQLLKIGKFSDIFYTRPEAPKTFPKVEDPSMIGPSIYYDPETYREMPKVTESLKDLKDRLADLTKQYLGAAIGGDEFNKVSKEMIALEERIEEIMSPHVDTIQLQAKGIHDLGYAYKETNGVVLQFGNIMIDEQKRTEDIIRAYNRLAKELQNISFIGSQIGDIFKQSFGAALENTEDFFTVLKEGFKNYIKQVLAMAAATLALAVTIKLAGGGASFKEIFTEVGLGMGLPFGFDPKDGKLRLAGPDLIGAVQRNQISIDRTGG